MDTKVLRPYQSSLVSSVKKTLSGEQENALIEQPTGSGKSLAITTIAASLFKTKYDHIIIAAPQQQIEDGFKCKDLCIQFPEIKGAASNFIHVDEDIIKAFRDDNTKSIKDTVLEYLQFDTDNIGICTHAALATVVDAFKADTNCLDLSRCLLVIDESHHCPFDEENDDSDNEEDKNEQATDSKLGQFVSEWENRGGRLLFATATPYRKDGKAVCRDNMKIFRRPIHEHMEEGFAPKYLSNKIVGVSATDEVSASEWAGERVDNLNHRQLLINALCDQYEKDRKDNNSPKVIIRIPPGNSKAFMENLEEAFNSRFPGIRILNGVGTELDIKKSFIEKLGEERARTYKESKYDIVVGVQRILEGTDWSVCSHVYCIGIPSSLTMVTQLIGRSLRLKKDNHPWNDEANVVFFVLGANEGSLNKLDIKHSRHTLLSCIFLADYNVGKEWIVTKALSNGIKSGLKNGDITQEQAEDAENKVRLTEDPEEKVYVESILLAAYDKAKEDNVDCNLSYVEEFCQNNGYEVPSNLNQAWLEHISTNPENSENVSGKLEETTKNIAKNNISILPNIDKEKRSIFNEVVDYFREETLDNCESFKTNYEQTHRVTGSQLGEFCKRLLASNVCYTIEQVKGWVEEYYNRTGKYPSCESGDIIEADTTWSKIDKYFIRKSRGLVDYDSLSDFIDKEFNRQKTIYTIQQVKSWVEEYYNRTGKYPSEHSGNIPGTDIAWCNISGYFRRQSKGLAGYESLLDFLNKEFEHKIDYTIEQIKGWVEIYKNRTGKYPGGHSGDICGFDTTWKKVDDYFRVGSRGLIGYDSLSDFICKEFDRQIIHTIEQAKSWIETYYNRTGKYPSKASGNILGVDITWRNIDGYFRHKSKGLVGYKSLSDFIKKEFKS